MLPKLGQNKAKMELNLETFLSNLIWGISMNLYKQKGDLGHISVKLQAKGLKLGKKVKNLDKIRPKSG